jgi:trimethylamine:corrinoid methyltransferase-like protein
MIGSYLRYLSQDQAAIFSSKAYELLAGHGVKLDPHPELFDLLDKAGAQVEADSGMVLFPEKAMRGLLEAAPKSFGLGARNPEKAFELPRPEGRIYARTCTGGHGYVDPSSGEYRKLQKEDSGQLGPAGEPAGQHHLHALSCSVMTCPPKAPMCTAWPPY